MNAIYRIVWSAATGKWVVASEFAKGRKKASSRASLLSALALAAAMPVAMAAEDVAPTEERQAVSYLPNWNLNSAQAHVGLSLGDPQDDSYIKPDVESDRSLSAMAVAVNPGIAINLGNYSDPAANQVGDIAIGQNTVADSLSASGDHAAMAVGFGAKASNKRTVALGFGAQALQEDSIAMGYNAKSTASAAVALGRDSVADRANTISVGAAGKERQIVNVAAGTLENDAVNVAQLGSATRYFKAAGKNDGSDDPYINATDGGAIAIGAGSKVLYGADDGHSSGVAIGWNAASNASRDVALGAGATADARLGNVTYATALGSNATAIGGGTLAVGERAAVNGDNTVRYYGTALGASAQVSAINATAVGATASATAQNSVALGMGSLADRDNTVSIGASGASRQLVNVTAGTQDTDAVNFSQLKGSVQSTAKVLGGGAGVDANGLMTAPSYALDSGKTKVNTVADALGNLDTRVTTNAGNITTNATNIANVQNGVTGMVRRDATSGNLTVAAGLNGSQVDFTGANGTRQLKGVSAGTAGTDAVNLDQVKQIAAGAKMRGVAINIGDYADPLANQVGDIAIGQNTVADSQSASGDHAAVAVGFGAKASNKRTVALGFGAQALQEDSIAMGYNAKSTASAAVALGRDSVADRANTVSVGAAGKERQIVNVAAGTQETDVTNVGQLRASTQALGGGADLDANGQLVAPSYALDKGQVTSHTVGDAVNNLDGRITSNSDDIAQNTTDIATNTQNIARNTGDISDLQNGVTGLVQRDATSGNITVAKDWNGTQVDFTGTDGTRQLKGVTAGTDGTDAVNVNQLAQAKADATRYFKAAGKADGSDDATASADRSVAIGAGSLADRANTVSVGAAGAERQIVHVAAGTQNTDAANLAQLRASTQALGGGAGIDANGQLVAPSYALDKGQATAHTVGDAVSNLDGRVSGNSDDIAQNTADIATNTTNIAKNTGDISDLQNGVTGLVRRDATSGNLTVAKDWNGTQVDFTGTEGTRQLKGVTAGTDGTDAVNVNQLAQAKADATRYFKASGKADGSDDAVASADRSVAIGAGSLADRADTVSVGAVGAERQLVNVAAGTQDTDAANLGQLRATTQALGGGAGVGANGQLVAPSYALDSGKTTAHTVGDALSNLDGRVTTNTRDIATNTGDIADLQNGVTGMVQRDANTGNLTVAKGLNGAQVDFIGSEGARQLKGVAAGSDGTDAVNVAQLDGAIDDVHTRTTRYFKANGKEDGSDDAQATGETAVAVGAKASAQGDQSTAVGQGAQAIAMLATALGNNASAVGVSAVALGDGAKAQADHDIALGAGATADSTGGDDSSLAVGYQASASQGGMAFGSQAQAQFAQGVAIGQQAVVGEVGGVALGQNATVQEGATDSVALGKGSVADRANVVSVGSTGHERQVTNVADGTDETDAVNLRQLKKAGLVDDGGNLLDAVTYDAGSNRSLITLGGASGTTITNVAPGAVTASSTDAINGSQLWGAQQQINNLDTRVTVLENKPEPVLPPPVQANPHVATSGDPAQAAHATGASSVAVGEAAMATGSRSIAVGAASTASADNSVALGADSIADRANTVSVGSAVSQRQVTNVAAGTDDTDAVNVGQLNATKDWARDYTDQRFSGLNRRIDDIGRRADAGTASALATANLPQAYAPNQNSAGVGVGTYNGQSAIAVGLSAISESGRWIFRASATANTRGDKGAGVGAGFVW